MRISHPKQQEQSPKTSSKSTETCFAGR